MKKKYRAYGEVVGGKYIGVVEASSSAEAVQKAWEMDEADVNLCHSCSSECEDATLTSIFVEECE